MVGLWQEGVAWGWGELSKIPYKGVEQKRGEAKKRFYKKEGKLGQGVGALKREGGGTHLRTMQNVQEKTTEYMNFVENSDFIGTSAYVRVCGCSKCKLF